MLASEIKFTTKSKSSYHLKNIYKKPFLPSKKNTPWSTKKYTQRYQLKNHHSNNTPRDIKPWDQHQEHRNTGTPGHQDTGTPRHRDTRTPRHQNTGTPGHQEHQNTRTPGHQGTKILIYQDTSKNTNTPGQQYTNQPLH